MCNCYLENKPDKAHGTWYQLDINLQTCGSAWAGENIPPFKGGWGGKN